MGEEPSYSLLRGNVRLVFPKPSRLSWKITVLVVFCLFALALILFRPSRLEGPAASTVPAVPVAMGPLVSIGPHGQEPSTPAQMFGGWAYEWEVSRRNLPLLINIKRRVHIIKGDGRDLGYHQKETNLFGGFYKLYPAGERGNSTGEPPTFITVSLKERGRMNWKGRPLGPSQY